MSRPAHRQRVAYFVCALLLTFTGGASGASTAGFLSATPLDGQTVLGGYVVFSFIVSGLELTGTINVTIANRPEASAGRMLFPTETLSARSVTATVYSGSPFSPLTPGTYYWSAYFTSNVCPGVLGRCAIGVQTLHVVGPRGETGTAGRDVTPPTVSALPSSGRFGQFVRLRYRLSDDSAEAYEAVTVYRDSRKYSGVRIGSLRAVYPDVTYTALWLAPRRLPGVWSFCVNAWDGRANAAASCARLTLR